MRFFSCRLHMWVGKQLQTNFLQAIGFFSCRLCTWAGKQLQTNFLQAIGFFSCRLCMWVGKQLQTNYLWAIGFFSCRLRTWVGKQVQTNYPWAMGLFSCRSSIQLTLQSPILGYLWGYPIPGISEPWRYPILEWYDLHTYHTIPYHSTSYHTIPCHTIPSFQTCHRVSGVLFTQYKKYSCRLQYWSIRLHFLWTGSLDFFWHFKLQVEAIGWTWYFENQLNWALSQLLAIYTLDLATYTLALAIYTLDITSHLKLHILTGHLISVLSNERLY